MNKRILFHGMAKTDPMEEHCNKHLAKIESFLENERSPVTIDLTLTPSKVHAHHFVELRVKTPTFDKIASYEGPHFYDVVDHVIDTMYRQLREYKDKRVDSLKRAGRHDDVKKKK